jgi:hypothetical protein
MFDLAVRSPTHLHPLRTSPTAPLSSIIHKHRPGLASLYIVRGMGADSHLGQGEIQQVEGGRRRWHLAEAGRGQVR